MINLPPNSTPSNFISFISLGVMLSPHVYYEGKKTRSSWELRMTAKKAS